MHRDAVPCPPSRGGNPEGQDSLERKKKKKKEKLCSSILPDIYLLGILLDTPFLFFFLSLSLSLFTKTNFQTNLFKDL